MDTNEYFKQLPKLIKDDINPEFHTFTAVWMRSRMPEAYAELASRFQELEGQIMEQHMINDYESRQPYEFDDIPF